MLAAIFPLNPKGKLMSYIFKGNLCGYICADCPEALSDVTVRLYRHQQDQNITALAVANPKDTFTVLGEEALRAKESSLLAETKTDAQGRFAFDLSERSYKGEAFEVDIYCGTVPHRKPSRKNPIPRQASITTIQPLWKRTEAGFIAGWEYCIPYRYWCFFRGLFDAWTICGKVRNCQTNDAVANVKVTAFDTDWLQDDALGSAFTDANGKFRIDYTREDFEKTPWSPLLNVELTFISRSKTPAETCYSRNLPPAAVLATARMQDLASASIFASTSILNLLLTIPGSPMWATSTSMATSALSMG